jgi:hypothetical protein
VNHLVTVATRGRNDHFTNLADRGNRHGMLRLGDDQRDFAFFGGRDFGHVLGGRCFLGGRFFPDEDRLAFIGGALRRRARGEKHRGQDGKKPPCLG